MSIDVDPNPTDQTLSFQSTPLPAAHQYERLGKRTFDVVVSSCALVVFAPFLLFWTLLKLLAGQSVFFKQTRIGKDGVPFQCLKLQTMCEDADAVLTDLCAADPKLRAEWDKFQKLENDPRVTWFGRILRRFSIDEVPQFINVLWGDMSVVGPRPFMAEQEVQYRAAGGRRYYDVKPGITGLWQVARQHKTAFADRVSFDTAYTETLSFKQDLRIIGRTFAVLIQGAGR